MFPDPLKTSEFYLMGMIDSLGGVIKIKRVDGGSLWYGKLPTLAISNAYYIVDDSYHMLGCGSTTTTTTPSNVGLYRLQNDGTFKWFY